MRPKTKQSQRPIRTKEDIQKPIRTQSNNKQTRKARENASDQVAISFSFASDWLTRWRKLSRQIREQNEAKPVQYLIVFPAQLKI